MMAGMRTKTEVVQMRIATNGRPSQIQVVEPVLHL